MERVAGEQLSEEKKKNRVELAKRTKENNRLDKVNLKVKIKILYKKINY